MAYWKPASWDTPNWLEINAWRSAHMRVLDRAVLDPYANRHPREVRAWGGRRCWSLTWWRGSKCRLWEIKRSIIIFSLFHHILVYCKDPINETEQNTTLWFGAKATVLQGPKCQGNRTPRRFYAKQPFIQEAKCQVTIYAKYIFMTSNHWCQVTLNAIKFFVPHQSLWKIIHFDL